MEKNIIFRHYCGIEYHGLNSQEVQKLLDATKGDLLNKFYLSLTSEWIYDEATNKRIGRKETYSIRITSRDHYVGTDEEELKAWQEEQTKVYEEINKIIEEHTT